MLAYRFAPKVNYTGPMARVDRFRKI